jgi:hypothetical protein
MITQSCPTVSGRRSSAVSTAPYKIRTRGPTTTLPEITALGAIHAVGSTRAVTSMFYEHRFSSSSQVSGSDRRIQVANLAPRRLGLRQVEIHVHFAVHRGRGVAVLVGLGLIGRTGIESA